jgi:hypothetical protein
MTKLELSIDVSDQLAREAREAGLLAPDALADLLQEGVRRKALERIEAARHKAGPGKPMTLSELQEIVDSVRKRRA